MIKLKWPDRPSPFWFYSGRSEHKGRVLSNGRVDAEGSELELLEGQLPAAGSWLLITKERLYLVAELEADFRARKAREDAARQAEVNARHAQREAEYRQRRIQQQERAAAENAKLRIPVRWTSGLKTVLSGLSRSSSGTGENARSVAHVLLLEPVSEGRFQRASNTFLCTSASGNDGRAWTERLNTYDSGENGPYVSQVTCKQCLKLAQRWNSEALGVVPELVRG